MALAPAAVVDISPERVYIDWFVVDTNVEI